MLSIKCHAPAVLLPEHLPGLSFACFADGRLPLHARRSNGATEYVWNISAWSWGFEHVTFSQMPCNILSAISWNIACSALTWYMTHLMWYFHCLFIALSRNILWINTMLDKINYGGSGVFLLPVNKNNIYFDVMVSYRKTVTHIKNVPYVSYPIFLHSSVHTYTCKNTQSQTLRCFLFHFLSWVCVHMYWGKELNISCRRVYLGEGLTPWNCMQ